VTDKVGDKHVEKQKLVLYEYTYSINKIPKFC